MRSRCKILKLKMIISLFFVTWKVKSLVFYLISKPFYYFKIWSIFKLNSFFCSNFKSEKNKEKWSVFKVVEFLIYFQFLIFIFKIFVILSIDFFFKLFIRYFFLFFYFKWEEESNLIRKIEKISVNYSIKNRKIKY